MSELEVIENNIAGKGQVSFSQYKTNWKGMGIMALSAIGVVALMTIIGVAFTGCIPNTVYLKADKGEVLQMESCVKPDDKLHFAKVAPQKEGDKYVFDEENFFNLVQNAANLRNAYEELKVCYTNQVDYYVQVANL